MHRVDWRLPPKSSEEAGLERAFVADLVLKHLLCLGEFRVAEVAERVKLPISLVELVLEDHRKDQLIEVKSAANYSSMSYVFRLTDAGAGAGPSGGLPAHGATADGSQHQHRR
jgi:hypothetical protein